MISSELQDDFNQANHIVFLTGAGVSTASGIPDYRSKNGLYSKSANDRPEYLLSATAFYNEPDRQYRFMKDNMYFPDAKPNVIHEKMAHLVSLGKAVIITQNVDGLHQKTSFDTTGGLFEFHGSLYRIYAPVDHQPARVEDYLESQFRADGEILRPDITFYEETPQHVSGSIQAVQQSDLIVIVGTSFQVYPFASLISYAPVNAKIIAINQTEIENAPNINQIIGDAVEFFEELKI